MDDRKICIRLSLPDSLGIPTVVSEGTLVFSKRKNKEQREIQQLQEKQDMERREEEAVQQLLLQAKRQRTMTTTTTTSPSTTTTATNVDSGSLQEEVPTTQAEDFRTGARGAQSARDYFAVFARAAHAGPDLVASRMGDQSRLYFSVFPCHRSCRVATGAVGTVGEEPRNGSHSSPVSLFGIPPDLRREIRARVG
ncbi:hypothetical protein BASA82_000596 [Batrachochytrium salamandrivorans]|nr:hypothetical protein BASA82_000596 [Batrachochytrium salamandrivorans]